MAVDKFGHYYNNKFTSETLKKNVSKILGIIVDENYNLDVQNKKIRNVNFPTEGTDAVNKTYLHTEIKNHEDILKRSISKEVVTLRKEISDLNNKIDDVYNVMVSLAKSSYGKEGDSK